MTPDSLLRGVLTAAVLLVGSVSAEREPVVVTKAGSVRGTTLTSLLGNEFFSFKGETSASRFNFTDETTRYQ